jgi:methyl-accepting chemotaxis protein
MGFLKNIKISRKLTVGFLTVAFFAAVIGCVGIIGMLTISKDDTALYEEQTKPLEDMFDVVISVYNIRTNVRDSLIYAGNAGKMEELEKQTEELSEKFNSAAAAYELTIKNPDSKKLFNEAVDIYNNTFTPAYKQVFELTKKGDTAQASKVIEGVATDVKTMFNNLDICVANRMDSAKKTSDHNTATANTLTAVLVAITLLGITIALILGFYISNIISRPLNEIVSAAEKISLGYTDVNVDIANKDETGVLARSFNNMIAGIKKQAEIADIISHADFTVEVTPRSEGDTLGKSLKRIAEALNKDFMEIRDSAEQISTGANQVSDGAQTLSQGATEQASSIEELSASINQIAVQVKENSDNLVISAQYVEQAGAGIAESNEQMKEMLSAMSNINESSAEISKIIKIIDDIAFQTNILSLNAAVEAARAGAAGKGFAVVADEVRNLASKSADAVKQTTEFIEKSISHVQKGSHIAEKTAQALADVAVKAQMVTKSIEKISKASAEQADAIAQINTGVEQISAVVQNNSATAEESAAASEELSGQASVLKQMVSRMKLKNTSTAGAVSAKQIAI